MMKRQQNQHANYVGLNSLNDGISSEIAPDDAPTYDAKTLSSGSTFSAKKAVESPA